MPKMRILDRAKCPQKPPAPAGGRTSLANALFSSTQQRVLGLLFGQPDRSFFATELISLAAVGSGSVQRELQRLAESGLVTVTRVGNQKHYRANPAAPIFAELRGIVEKTIGPAEVLRIALAPLAADIRLALLYGSVAKGADHAASDIDLLIVADGLTLEQVYSTLASAEQRLGRPVSPTLYTGSEFARRRDDGNPFLSKVLAGDTIMLIGDQDAIGAAG
jgi:predicted nucleotidyltransferase